MSVTTERAALDELCVNTIRTLSMDAVAEGELGPPGHADGARADGVPALHAHHAPLAERPGLAGPRPLRALVRARVDAPLLDAAPDRATASRSTTSRTSASSARRAPATRSTATRPASRPRPARSARASRRASAWRSASACSPPAIGERRSLDHFTYVIASDGDLEEGISSEASSLAGHLGLGNLIVFYDDNHISIEGDTALAFSEDVGKRYEAYGWHVQNLGEDLALDRIEAAVRGRAERRGRPSLIIVRTHIAPGSPNKQDTHEAHGSPLGEEEIAAHQGGLRLAEPGAASSSPTRRWRTSASASTAGASCTRSGSATFEAGTATGAELERLDARRLPDGWDSDVPTKGPDAGHDRHPQGLQRGASSGSPRKVPELVGGSADLAPSTLTLINGGGSVEARRLRRPQPPLRHPRARDGRDRQRPRPAAGFRAFGAGFLIFSDYMKGVDPARRAHAHPVDRSCSRTTRSASARTARRTSRSSSSRRCARRRTSTSCGPRASTRPRSPGGTRCARRTARPCSRCRARACRCGIRAACPPTRSSAAPTCCTRPPAATRS